MPHAFGFRWLDGRRLQGELGIVMKRLFLAAGLLALAGCESAPEDVPPAEAAFVTDDCALIGAVGREQYKLSADDPKMSIRLNGEDAPWRPGCDWAQYGFNVIEVSGPEGETATTGMSRITFNRPRYDATGAQVRTSITSGAETTAALCRVTRGEGGNWSLASCGPDPKLTQPRPAAPSPADQTPDARAPVPINPDVAPRDAIIPPADPGAPPGGGPG
jgi:hypothetical protein